MIYSFDLPSGVTWWDIISTRKRTSTDVLRRKFERYGEIGDAYIPRDRSTGGKTENILFAPISVSETKEFDWISNRTLIHLMILNQTILAWIKFWFFSSIVAHNIRSLGVPFEIQPNYVNTHAKKPFGWISHRTLLIEVALKICYDMWIDWSSIKALF